MGEVSTNNHDRSNNGRNNRGGDKEGENMKRFLSILALAIIASSLLSSCNSGFSLKDIPLPAGFSPVTDQQSMLPLWSIEQSKVTDGLYIGYKVDEQAYYSCQEAVCGSIYSFFQSRLAPSGWTPTTATSTVLYYGKGWTKGNQVIYVAFFASGLTNSLPGNEIVIFLLSGSS